MKEVRKIEAEKIEIDGKQIAKQLEKQLKFSDRKLYGCKNYIRERR